METTDSPENRCPVRRSGRQPKRTDKLEEFLMTAKRGSRKSAPPSVESGDPPSQTPTDAETASEASFDGNADSKIVEDKADSPERRTRSSAKKQVQKKTQGGRQTRSSAGRVMVKEEGSSENEDDGKDDKSGQSQDGSQGMEESKPDPASKAIESIKAAEDSEKTVPQETNVGGAKSETEKETDEEDTEKSEVMTRKPVRTYVNKKRVSQKSPVAAKPPPVSRNTVPAKKEAKPKAVGKISKQETTEEEDDDDESFTSSSSSSSSSSNESDDGGYDPNALYCICRQKHNKRFVSLIRWFLLLAACSVSRKEVA